ncbi:hypothetical protein Lal_00032498 [Lupinus albus]|nr:hypothetical protein Lal_00032498 [Lupinus albus]
MRDWSRIVGMRHLFIYIRQRRAETIFTDRREILSNEFSDDEDIELCCDDEEDLELDSSELANITYVSEDPGIPVKALVKEIVTRFGYTVTYRKTWTAKQIAMSQIYGDWEGSYKELPRWFNTVQCYAAGTIVRYASSRHDESSSLILDRVFWAFKPCIEGFGFCKPILQVDGTFLTGKYNGTLLIASSQDVYCIRHVASNFNKEFKDGDLKEKVIQMGYELLRPRFERMLDDLRQKNPRAAAWLDNIPKEKWTQSYDEGRRYGHMTTNLAECVNGVLKGSRVLPITSLVQATYHRLNSWFLHHRNEATSMIMAGHIYCEELTKVLNENNRKATCQTIQTFSRESGVFVVEVPGREGSRHSKVYTLRLNQYWCECGEFQSLRLPCSHVIATCSSMNLDYRQFISPIYRLDNLLKAYGREFEPIGNEEYRPHYSGPMFIPNPLMRRNRTGRPKTSRIHNEMDDCATEKNKKCGLCRTEGHNRKTCPFKNSEIGESSRH